VDGFVIFMVAIGSAPCVPEGVLRLKILTPTSPTLDLKTASKSKITLYIPFLQNMRLPSR